MDIKRVCRWDVGSEFTGVRPTCHYHHSILYSILYSILTTLSITSLSSHLLLPIQSIQAAQAAQLATSAIRSASLER